MPKPRLLLDENIGHQVSASLKEAGWDVVSVLEASPGVSDMEVMKLARKEKRLIVTLDRDFGTLVFRDSHRHIGVLLLRLQIESPANILSVLLAVLEQYGHNLRHKFVVATDSQIRIRKI